MMVIIIIRRRISMMTTTTNMKMKYSMLSILHFICLISIATSFAPTFQLSPLSYKKVLNMSNKRSGETISRTWDVHHQRSSSSSSSSVTSSTITTTPDKTSKRKRHRQKTQPMPIAGYDANAILEHYDRRPFQVGWRLNSLAFPLLGWYLQLRMDKAMGKDDDIQLQKLRGQQLRNLLVQSRSVALIKSGQALSLRPDIIRNVYWAEELGKLVDAVGAFSDIEAMKIMRHELGDLRRRLEVTKNSWKQRKEKNVSYGSNRLQKLVETDEILSLFEFYNDYKSVASASIGQVYKARIRRGPQLEAAIGKEEAARWGGRLVAVKVQRPDVEQSASLDMYLLRRTAMWLNKVRGGDLPKVADAFGMQLFGELDYVREANNCERFRDLYGDWEDIRVPAPCTPLTRKRVLVLEWIDGEKGPWPGDDGLNMVSIGLRCSVDQLMTTGLFHSDPHRGNLLKTPDNKLALIDFGMMSDIDEEFRYGLFGLVIGLQNKDISLVTENLLKLGFLKDTTQLDQLVPRLGKALKNATGGTGKASDVSFSRLQAELDAISRENVVRFTTPPFLTVIIRSLTILEGVALSVDQNFRLVRGAYPYVLRQLLSDEEGETPEALQNLLIRLLTIDGKGEEIDWERLRDFLRLAQKASKKYDPSKQDDTQGSETSSTLTIRLFAKFLTSRTGLFLKKPLVHELAETIDGIASMGEANLLRISRGFFPLLPGSNGPINARRMEEMRIMIDTLNDAISQRSGGGGVARMEAIMEILGEISSFLRRDEIQSESGILLEELQSVAQMVAVEVLEIRGARAIRNLMGA